MTSCKQASQLASLFAFLALAFLALYEFGSSLFLVVLPTVGGKDCLGMMALMVQKSHGLEKAHRPFRSTRELSS